MQVCVALHKFGREDETPENRCVATVLRCFAFGHPIKFKIVAVCNMRLLFNKLRDNKPEEVRTCIKCNTDCTTRGFTIGHHITCAVNAQVGRETFAVLKPYEKEEKVVVIGGGVAGLEAARASAIRGAKVTLFEKDSILGGTARLIASPAWKYRFRDLFSWYELQMKELGVDVKLNTTVTADCPALKEATRIYVGTGSTPVVPPIPGIDGKKVANVLDVHANVGSIRGSEVVVCVGGMSGCEIALELAEDGNKVSIVEMMSEVARDASRWNGVTLMNKLAENNIAILTDTKVKAFNDDGVVVETKDGESLIKADVVVNAFGIKANNALAEELTKIIGDKVHVS